VKKGDFEKEGVKLKRFLVGSWSLHLKHFGAHLGAEQSFLHHTPLWWPQETEIATWTEEEWRMIKQIQGKWSRRCNRGWMRCRGTTRGERCPSAKGGRNPFNPHCARSAQTEQCAVASRNRANGKSLASHRIGAIAAPEGGKDADIEGKHLSHDGREFWGQRGRSPFPTTDPRVGEFPLHPIHIGDPVAVEMEDANVRQVWRDDKPWQPHAGLHPPDDVPCREWPDLVSRFLDFLDGRGVGVVLRAVGQQHRLLRHSEGHVQHAVCSHEAGYPDGR